MTFLELVNNVLIRLREEEVSTWNETTYSNMIGGFVNDAIQIVQQRHQWSSQFSEITVSAVDGTQNYTLDGMGEFGQIMDIINDTSNIRMRQVSTEWMNTQTNMGGTEEGAPYWFSFNGTASDRDPQIDIWPIPDTSYTILVRVFTKQAELSVGSTEVVVPAQPVLQYALAFAIRERGEVGGTNFNEQLAFAKTTLSEDIAADAERFPELQIWESGTIPKALGSMRWRG